MALYMGNYFAPISGVRTLLITGEGAHFVEMFVFVPWKKVGGILTRPHNCFG